MLAYWCKVPIKQRGTFTDRFEEELLREIFSSEFTFIFKLRKEKCWFLGTMSADKFIFVKTLTKLKIIKKFS